MLCPKGVIGWSSFFSFVSINRLWFPYCAYTKIPFKISFLGHIGFYQIFIKDFSKIAKPLSNLLAKNALFDFNIDCINFFFASWRMHWIWHSSSSRRTWAICLRQWMTQVTILRQRKNKKAYVIYNGSYNLDKI